MYGREARGRKKKYALKNNGEEATASTRGERSRQPAVSQPAGFDRCRQTRRHTRVAGKYREG